ncbi:MAG: LacI family DNA-binding transcriptional regulator [Lachnospiraceae bacterium]|nr:LacI family DNA-binding transcriptional regulator [Lachnospiraceae bacterium]
MANGKVTIKQIADMAGVSIATVSHVINRTRYVSPELVERIERIIRETGYSEKIVEKERKLKVGKASMIVAVFPNVSSTIYRDMVDYLRQLITEQGYRFYVAVTGNDKEEECQLLEGLLSEKKLAGILHVPVSEAASDYKMLIQSGVPFVCMERNLLGEGIDAVEFRDREGMFAGTEYLLKCGHRNILLLREQSPSTTREERTRGFIEALQQYNINVNDANIEDINIGNEDKSRIAIQRTLNRIMPTAVITSGNRLTLYLMKTVRDLGIECPEELSVIGFGDDSWSELTYPPLTILKRDVKGLCQRATAMLFEKINAGKVIMEDCYADIELIVRKSTKMLDSGPYGERAATPDSIVLTNEEKKQLRNGHFRVAISFHYTGTAWAELHEKGIRDELERYGIDIVSVMDAHFDPKLQNVQLEGLRLQRPDAVIAIPVDDKATAVKFQELSAVSKLVFLSNVPEKLNKNNYVSCVSVNEWENGTNTGRLMGEYFKERKSVKAGFIIHGAAFSATRSRDSAAEKIIQDNYKNIEIVTVRNFVQIENTYQVCKEVMEMHPEIETLYISWDQPALLAIKALKELGRSDVAVFTTDLDRDIAYCMEEGIVRGMSTQRPYEQGRTAALVVAKSLVSDGIPKYVGVQPYIVEGKQLRRAWKDIFHEPMPERLK